ncbi:GNAT family N-acetyltransferase [Neobacillus muris]|uniref:GNAT family N-acetyltransferase n=1 Tax=Neobacillus muris TaxID=2941334 RepID=UPI00203D4425|nr:GNAT family N-acetyltransferase [Neobacillus muris]
MEVIIESANINDFHAINLIVKEGQDEHSDALPQIFQKVDQVMPETYFRELLDDAECEILLAKVNEQVAGFAIIELNESLPFDSLTPRRFAYINDFGVKSSSQRNGIGKALYKACVNWAKRKDAASIELNVWEFNNKALAFYESLGMKTISRTMTLPL